MEPVTKPLGMIIYMFILERCLGVPLLKKEIVGRWQLCLRGCKRYHPPHEIRLFDSSIAKGHTMYGRISREYSVDKQAAGNNRPQHQLNSSYVCKAVLTSLDMCSLGPESAVTNHHIPERSMLAD